MEVFFRYFCLTISVLQSCLKFPTSVPYLYHTVTSRRGKSYFLLDLLTIIIFLQSTQNDINAFSKRMLHGKGYDRWFDKSFNLIICKNGQVGLSYLLYNLEPGDTSNSQQVKYAMIDFQR